MKHNDIVFSFFGFFPDNISSADRLKPSENYILYQQSFRKFNGTGEFTGSAESILSEIPNVADYDWNDPSIYSNTNPDVYLTRALKEGYFQRIIEFLLSYLKQDETSGFTGRVNKVIRDTLLKINDPKIDDHFVDILMDSGNGSTPYYFVLKLRNLYLGLLNKYLENINYFNQGIPSIDDQIEENQNAIDSSVVGNIDISSPDNIKVKTVKATSSFAWGDYGIIEWIRENANDNNSPFLTNVNQGTVIAYIKNPENINQKVNVSVFFSGTIIEHLRHHGSYIFVNDALYIIGENDRFNAPVFDQNAKYVWQNFMFIQILINIKTTVDKLSTDTESYSIDVNISTDDDPVKAIIERYVVYNTDQDTVGLVDNSNTSNHEDVNTNYSQEQAAIDIIKLIMINGTSTAYPDDLSAKNSSIYDDIENVFLNKYTTNIPTENIDTVKKIIDFTAKQIYSLTSEKIGTSEDYLNNSNFSMNQRAPMTQDFNYGYVYGDGNTAWMNTPIDRICKLAGHEDTDKSVKTDIYKILLVAILRDQRSVEKYYDSIRGQSLPTSVILLENRKYTPYDALQNTLVS